MGEKYEELSIVSDHTVSHNSWQRINTMQPVTGQQCECSGCPNCSRYDEERSRHLHGQKELFTNQVMELYRVQGVWLCRSCLPKPIVEPVNLDRQLYNCEMARLEQQETLFDFR